MHYFAPAYGFLFDIGFMIMSAAAVVFIARAMRQPAIVAYIIAGLLIGPFGFGIVENKDEVMALSELGVSFLLFGAAVEINLMKLKGIGMQSLLAALLQVPLTFLLAYLLSIGVGLDQMEGIIIGFALAFSSTMVVVKVLQDAHKLHTLHARLQVALLILQDVIIILVLAYLASIFAATESSFAGMALAGVGLFSIAVLLNRFAFPAILPEMAKSSETLFLFSVAVCFVFMFLAFISGFSVAVGAFIAGISLSTFPYNIEVSSKVRSLRDFFAAIFFVSLGMQLSPSLYLGDLSLALILIGFILLAKPLLIWVIYLILGFGPRVSFLTSLGLSQISEFSFIIALVGLKGGLISASLFSTIIMTAMATMALTPYLMGRELKFYEVMKSTLLKLGLKFMRIKEDVVEGTKMRNHIILLGAHRMGNVILKQLKGGNILVVDYNPDIIRNLRKEGINCIYGDVYSDETLNRLNIRGAKALICTIPDENVALSVIRRVRRTNPKIRIFAKASYAEDAIPLYDAGADLIVIPDLLSGEAFARVIKESVSKPGKMRELKRKFVEMMKEQAGFTNKNFLR